MVIGWRKARSSARVSFYDLFTVVLTRRPTCVTLSDDAAPAFRYITKSSTLTISK